MKPMLKSRQMAWLFAFLYLVSYTTRLNFAAVIQEVVTDTGFEKSVLSAVLVCLSVSYGVGQIINGRIGDRILPQNLILMGLCTATAVNLLFPFFSGSVPAMCVLWTVNGFAQAMMWPPMAKIMVCGMDEAAYGSAVIIVSMGSSMGTVLVYLTAPLVIRLFHWRMMMFGAAAIGIIGVVIWLLFKDRCYRPAVSAAGDSPAPAEKQPFRLPRGVLLPFILIAVGVILQGMIRDGVTSWMPSYLSENFAMANDISIFLTVSLALFSMVSFTVAGAFYKRFFKNELSCAAVIFGLSALCALLLLLLFDAGGAVLAVIMMALITGCMHGVNLMLISHVPKRFRRHGNISTVSGLVNSFTYVGSAIATFGVAKLSEVFGWRITVAVWLGILTLGALSCLIAAPKWRKFIEGP